MYAALRLLQSLPNCTVKVVEKRSSINRPQVVGLPFTIAKDLPNEIKEKLWPDAGVRETILGKRSRSDLGFWPHSDVKYSRYIQIGEFQRVIIKYMEANYNFERFTFEVDSKLDVNFFRKQADDFDLILVAAGNGDFTKNLRHSMNLSSATCDIKERDETDRRGAYLIFEADGKEDYLRDGNLIARMDMAARGITYVHSNNIDNHVHIYSYPVGELRDIYAKMPEAFKATAGFTSSTQPLRLNGKKGDIDALSVDEQRWFQVYSSKMKSILQDFQVHLPSDDKIQVYFAPRCEYYYDVAGGIVSRTPVLFIGDACGCTDFKLGFSLGRGLIETKKLSDKIRKEKNIAFKGIIDYHNQNWQSVITAEFNQRNPLLTRTPEVIFKYYMDGQIVDGEALERNSFIEEFNQIVSQKL